jgi:hypothetical protein
VGWAFRAVRSSATPLDGIVEIDGHILGLIDASDPDEDYEVIQLVPNDLAFYAPWNGEYDT